MDQDKVSPRVPEGPPRGHRNGATTHQDVAPGLPFVVVGIGASAGGLEAFLDFFGSVSSDTGMAYVLVQHLPPDRESLIVEILSSRSRIPIRQVEDGIKVEPDHAYVIRPGRTMTIKDGHLRLSEPVEKPGYRRPVDDFFRSLAEEQRERAICIVMSGMGSNGAAGAQLVKAVGGVCIAQDPESAKFPSMPQRVIASGLADFVLRPAEMPALIDRYRQQPYIKGEHHAETDPKQERQVLNDILAVLRTRLRQDFSGYKKPTLIRRIERRMGLHQVVSMIEYARLLRQNPVEVAALCEDLLINVTGFFRDADVWEELRQKVIVPLVKGRPEDTPIRGWVTACSSGEEAYTLAILLIEAAEAANKKFNIKIFATDTAERSLGRARVGIYPGGIESEISPQRLERFFEREDSSYRVKKELRELIVFAPQNVLQDPPFSRLDICTCRNLLIYLEPEIQRRALTLIHFALREGGTLLLGSSETISGVEDLYEPVDKRNRLFRRLGPTRHGTMDFTLPKGVASREPALAISPPGFRPTVGQMAQQALLASFSPAAVVIDRQQRIVYFHGETDLFLLQPKGEPTRELLVLARVPLRGALRGAVQKAIADGVRVAAPHSYVEDAGRRWGVEITVAPLEARSSSPAHFIVTLAKREEEPLRVPEPGSSLPDDLGPLQEELQRTRNELQSTIEELQTSNEEMRASNEETTSINEELQSTNEELETSKEELVSLNEELTTVNAELQAKMSELEATTNDLGSLLSSTNIAVIFLDTKFQIRRYTPAVKDLMDLIPADLGRPLSALARKFVDDRLLEDAQRVLDKLVPLEKEITSESGRIYLRRALPYRTEDNRIDGVVLTFVDIGERKQAEVDLRRIEERSRLILEGIKEYAIFMLDADGMIATWTKAAERVLGWSSSEALGKHFRIICTAEDRMALVPEKELTEAGASGSVSEDHWHLRKDGTRFWGSGMLYGMREDQGKLTGFVKVLRDNTDQKLADEAILETKRAAEEANEAKDQFLANVSHELRTPLSAMLLWSKLLAEGAETVSPAVREGLDAITRCAREQQELIEDLVDTSRIVSGKLRLDTKVTDLAPMIRAAVEAIRPAAQAKDIFLEESYDHAVGLVSADTHRLHQVVWNLLSNAVKFTPAGGRVSVSLQRNMDDVEIRVVDTGQGITPEFLPHVFERFHQADNSTSRSQSGLGLGLAITKQLVELHGGVVSAESQGLGRGSTFIAILPLPALDPSTAGKVGSAPPNDTIRDLKGVRLLLVEDAGETRRALSALLRSVGAEVKATANADEAIAEYEAHRPDIIISDIGLPGTDGHELIRKIRLRDESRGELPVIAIALTAFADESNRRKALKSGFVRCLTKPIEPAKLISTLSKLRGNHSS